MFAMSDRCDVILPCAQDIAHAAHSSGRLCSNDKAWISPQSFGPLSKLYAGVSGPRLRKSVVRQLCCCLLLNTQHPLDSHYQIRSLRASFEAIDNMNDGLGGYLASALNDFNAFLVPVLPLTMLGHLCCKCE